VNLHTVQRRHRVVVLGAGYAGMSAATRLAKQVRPDTVSVDLVNATGHFVERPRLHQVAVGQTVPGVPLSTLIGKAAVTLTVGWVHRIDLAAHRVDVATNSGPTSLPYDTLVYALGSGTDTSAVPGIDPFAHTLDPAEARRLAARGATVREGGVCY
jgi:NADH:ubiquinone reductase (H+-translocating)